MYEFQRRIINEAAKYQKDENAYDPIRDGWEGMEGSTSSSDDQEAKPIAEAGAVIQAGTPKTGVVDQNKETKDRLVKYRVPMSFIANFKELRKKKATLPGSHIMWSKDDQDLDVIPAKDVETFMHKYGWVIIESIEEQSDEGFAFVSFEG